MVILTQHNHALWPMMLLYPPRWIKMVISQEWFSTPRNRTTESDFLTKLPAHICWRMPIEHGAALVCFGSCIRRRVDPERLTARLYSFPVVRASEFRCCFSDQDDGAADRTPLFRDLGSSRGRTTAEYAPDES